MDENRRQKETAEISVILPTYNEAGNIAEVVNRLKNALPGIEIIVVDDNSPDGTGDAAERAGAEVIVRTDERGLASAIHDGILAANGKIIAWMDADLSMPPEALALLAGAVAAGADIAVGSRYAPGGSDSRPLVRVLTSRLINRIANLLLPVKVKDYDSGFVAARKEVFLKVSFPRSGYGEYCIEFLCAAGLAGFSIREVGYAFTDRRAGVSKTTLSALLFIRTGIQYLRRIFLIRKRAGG